jgi:hypothetical protein
VRRTNGASGRCKPLQTPTPRATRPPRASRGSQTFLRCPAATAVRPNRPVNETPVNETPVNELPVNELPINEVPVNEIGFDDLASTVPALGNVTLASIPLLRTGGWTKVLSDPPGTPLGGLPLQNVTLRDYYGLPANDNPETRSTNQIPPITLADLDLSPSPLGSLPRRARARDVKLSECARWRSGARPLALPTARRARSPTRQSCPRRCRARP